MQSQDETCSNATSCNLTVGIGPNNAIASVSISDNGQYVQGGWDLYSGYEMFDHASASLTDTITLPTDSGNWILTGWDSVFFEADYPAGLPVVSITGSNGDIWGLQADIYNTNTLTTITVDHTWGTPLQLQLFSQDNVGDDGEWQDDMNFGLSYYTIAPEPATIWLILIPVVIFAAYRCRKMIRFYLRVSTRFVSECFSTSA